jgi:hypothetical protein
MVIDDLYFHLAGLQNLMKGINLGACPDPFLPPQAAGY